MNKIHFHPLRLREGRFRFAKLIIFFVLLVINLFNIFTMDNPSFIKYILVILFATIVGIEIIPFFYKNFVEWNKKEIVIKLNHWTYHKTFKFKNIANFDFDFEDNVLKIDTYNGKTNIFSLKNIDPQSIVKLKEILDTNIKIIR